MRQFHLTVETTLPEKFVDPPTAVSSLFMCAGGVTRLSEYCTDRRVKITRCLGCLCPRSSQHRGRSLELVSRTEILPVILFVSTKSSQEPFGGKDYS